MKRYVFSLFFLVALVLGTYNPSMAEQQESVGSQSLAPLVACSNNGSGANKLNVCVTNHGNLVRFESPQGAEYINSGTVGEGYAICDTAGGNFVDGYDAGFAESGCGAPTISQPNAGKFPVTITRNCDCVQFKQVWAKPDNTEKDITVTMTVKNICGFSLPSAFLDRYFDADFFFGGSGDLYDKSTDSAWGRGNLGNTSSLALTALTFGTSHSTFVEAFLTWFDTSHTTCFGVSSVATPTGSGDFVGRVRYNLGSFSPNQSKTVKMVYRRK